MTTGTVNQTSSGQTYITGTLSGLDTNSLIQAAVNAKLLAATRLDDQVTVNTNKVSAYQYLQTYSQSVQTALTTLKSTTDINGNALDGKKGTFTASDSSDATKIISSTITNTALNGTHTVIVQQTAKAQAVSSTEQTTRTTALGYTGTFDIGIAGKTAATINVTATSSLSDIATAINSQSTTTGVSADIVQTSTGKYTLVLTATDTNKAISVSNVTGDDALNLLGVTDGVGAFVNENIPAAPAIIKLDGLTVQSDSNTFSSVLTGVTFDVSKEAPTTTLTLKIGTDTDRIKSAITSFISSYNTLANFVKSQQQVNTDGSVATGSVLFGDVTLRTFNSDVSRLVSSNFGAGGFSALGAIGITLDTNNNLVLSDSTALDDALADNLSDVKSLFSTQFSSSNSDLTLSSNTSDITTPFTLDVTTNGSGIITGVSVGGNSNAFTFVGHRLIGKIGTIYEGLELAYNGAASASVTVSLQQGFADTLYNKLNDYSEANTGIFDKVITETKANDDELTQKSTDIRSAADDYRTTLINKYAAMEAAIQTSNNTIAILKALLTTNKD